MNPYIEKQDICIFSYNSRGFSMEKQYICSKILNHIHGTLPILCNQENFLLRNNKYKIKQALPGYHIIFKPAVKDNLEGRPRNGMFIAVPDVIKDHISDVSPIHWRIQANVLRSKEKTLLIINTYFPQDSKSTEYKDNELEEVLADIRTILSKNQFDDVIWAGDINVDFIRNSTHVQSLNDYIAEHNFAKSWDIYPVDFTHEHTVNDETHVSTIDHFFWNSRLSNDIIEAGVLHLVENTSDHHPIFCLFKFDTCINSGTSEVEKSSNPSWKRETVDQHQNFVHELDLKLKTVLDILECSDVHCSNVHDKYFGDN